MKICQSVIGSLLWFSPYTRTDIALPVHRVSPRAHAPRDRKWRWARRYLKGIVDLKFKLNGTLGANGTQEVVPEGYSDVDDAADLAD